jgi:hypothetical protein
MVVALVVNGVPDLQLSMECGMESLQLLLTDRQRRGCTIMPSEEARFGVEYKIQHPTHGVEVIYLTQFADAGDDLDATG